MCNLGALTNSSPLKKMNIMRAKKMINQKSIAVTLSDNKHHHIHKKTNDQTGDENAQYHHCPSKYRPQNRAAMIIQAEQSCLESCRQIARIYTIIAQKQIDCILKTHRYPSDYHNKSYLTITVQEIIPIVSG